AADAGAAVAHPLLHPRVLAALAALPPERRFRGRTAAMAALAGDLLPEAVLRRGTKAGFGAVFAADHARALATRWDGAGVDAALVDRERLRRAWLAPAPDPRALTALQSAWLAKACQAETRSSSAPAAASIDDHVRGRDSSHAGRPA
ncbi:MAG TPA: asparagine synthase-related protein, partial [Baekduia sp.]|nr:asparagine synthase-related protein [Baekduia sp.]